MTPEEMARALAAPFPAADIEWRVGSTTKDKTRGLALAYIDARAVQKRLDEVCGPFGWQTRVSAAARGTGWIVELGIQVGEKWIWRTDAADETAMKGGDGAQKSDAKGGVSGALKRAAAQFGVGRYLYGLDAVWHPIKAAGASWALDGTPALPAWALPAGEAPAARPAPQQRQPPPQDRPAAPAQPPAQRPAEPQKPAAPAAFGTDQTVFPDGFADSDLPAIPVKLEADGWPAWAKKPLLFGEHKGKSLIEMTQGAPDGGRRQWLEWAAFDMPLDPANNYHQKNLQQKAAYRWLFRRASEEDTKRGAHAGAELPEDYSPSSRDFIEDLERAS